MDTDVRRHATRPGIKAWAPMRVLAGMLAVAGALVVAPALAHAQSAADLESAGRAFQEGQRAQMHGDFAQAAEMFDLANHTAPSAAALRSAIRMHTSAGHHAAAATRAAHALATYPDDAATVELANQVIAGCGALTGRVIITCAPDCALTIAGRIVSSSAARSEVYVDPGVHTIRASWGAATLERQVTASAGSSEEIALVEADAQRSETPVAETETETETETEAATEATGATETETATTPTGPSRSSAPASGGGLTPIVFGIAAALTVAAGGAAIGVGLDMLGARDRYVAMPSEAGWRDGVMRETVTNALIGTSIGLAAVTVVLAILTDWDGEPSTSESRAFLFQHLRLGASPDGAHAAFTLSL